MVQLEEFGALGLTDVTLEAIKAKGFETPSPIQKLTIPVLLDDEKTNDIIAQAQTGTEINIDGKDYLIMKQGDILAII